MIRPRPLAVLSAVLAAIPLAIAPARAQSADGDLLTSKFDPSTCGKQSPASTAAGAAAVPVTWTDFELTGTLVDPAATVRRLFEPTMSRHRALTDDAREEIKRAAARFGYHVVGIGTRDTTTGTHAVIHLAPQPIVRWIDVDVKQSLIDTLLRDEIGRRMGVRVGGQLPWDPHERACELHEETARVEEFLRDEGYHDARARISQRMSGAAIKLKVSVQLGPEYTVDVDQIDIADADGLAIDASEIRDKFRHLGSCLVGPYVCIGKPRFTRSQHQADVQKVVQLFHDRGYPAVRVRSDYDPVTSPDRRTKKVRFGLTIDQRRRLDVVFEGHNPGSVSTQALRQQLTFDQASSTDDVEANASARAIAAYLQSRGYFDARVTWTRERFGVFDRLIFRIDQGETRSVRSVSFAGNRAIPAADLSAVVATKAARLSNSLFGSNVAATSSALAADVDRLVDLYRRRGYRDARVRVAAGPDPSSLESAALTAALLSSRRGGGLHVRFTIEEGQPTLLTQVHVQVGDHGDELRTPDERVLCRQVLRDLADLYKHEGLSRPATNERCVATAANLAFREDDVAASADQLRDRLYSHGRPRAEVRYEQVVLGPRRIA
ncbi:MAG: POTRA domain-containing protein, partial [Kofleriaceae bacterium]